MSNINLNDQAWEQLFEKYDILYNVEHDGCFSISAAQIKEFREPRLMAKFDHTVNLPRLFSENKLAILPVTRGDYVISHFEAYHRFEEGSPAITRVTLPDYILSLDSSNIPSEAIALNCAAASGILEDFMDDEGIFATVSGRMASGAFSFNICDSTTDSVHQVSVNNSQIEIDAAYEGIASLALFEAKRDLSEDFLVRQLYYPFRTWHNRVKKPIKPIFLVYSNGIYRLYEYAFEDVENYNSLRLVKQKNYSIEDTAISVSDIQHVLETVKIVNEPVIPFPQANNFERVINLCELVNSQELSRADVTEKYDFNARQTNYYTDAARYLGLLDKRRENGTPIYSISDKGRSILKMCYKQRQLAYCSSILSHKAFHTVMELYLQCGFMPSKDKTVDIMKKSGLFQVESENTFYRRASTIRGWVDWIISLINE